MPRKYNKIACAIGRGIDERLERIGSEPLPQKLVDLLNRLTERGDPTVPMKTGTTPPKTEVLRPRAKPHRAR